MEIVEYVENIYNVDEELQEIRQLELFLADNAITGSEFKKNDNYAKQKYYTFKPIDNSGYKEQSFSTIESEKQLINIFTTDNISNYICRYDDYSHWSGYPNWTKICNVLCEVADIPDDADVVTSNEKDIFNKDIKYIYVSKVILGPETNIWSDKDFCVEILKKNKNNRHILYSFMNKEIITKDIIDSIYEDELRTDIMNLGYTKENISRLYSLHPGEVTYELCAKLVQESRSLYKIPTIFITEELALNAIKLRPDNIHFIPDKLKNDIMYDIVMKSKKYELYKYIPVIKITQEYWYELIDYYSADERTIKFMLKRMPNAFKTPELITKCVNLYVNLILEFDVSLINYTNAQDVIYNLNKNIILTNSKLFNKIINLVDKPLLINMLCSFHNVFENICELYKRTKLTYDEYLKYKVDDFERFIKIIPGELMRDDILEKIQSIYAFIEV